MRTTLTLDEDVATRLRAEARRTGRSFKELVNHHLRLGLQAVKKPTRFKVHTRDLGALRPDLSLDNIAKVTDVVEGPRHR